MRVEEQMLLASVGAVLFVLSDLAFKLTNEYHYLLFAVSGMALVFGPELKHRFG